MFSVTHFTDPGCPFAYSASPALAILRWRYGDQLSWRHVMIGLTEDAAQYAERGYTTLWLAQGQRRFHRFGMPFGSAPKQRLSATARACRAVVAVRLERPELEWAALRALQFTNFTTSLPLDGDEALLAALRYLPGVDPHHVVASLDSAAVTEAYEADRAQARTAAGTATEFQGKAANTDGAVRYTAPSLLFSHRDGRTLEAGGYQPVEAYDVVIANLDPTLSRRPPAEDVVELLAAFPYALTTREVAAVMAPHLVAPDERAAEEALIAAAGAGTVRRRSVGGGAVWHQV